MIRLLILFIPFFLFAVKPDLLLLKTYKDQNITGWVMSEKLDGIRAYWNGKNLISRGGKIIHAPKWFTKNYPPFEIDGEIWSKRGDFENIASIVIDKIVFVGGACKGELWAQILADVKELWQEVYENQLSLVDRG